MSEILELYSSINMFFYFWQVKGPMDNSHFDIFPPDTEKTPDELSGWDKDFW